MGGIIRAYAKQFKPPRSRGKVSELYVKDELIDTDHVRHFASDVLGMLPLLFAFLIEKAVPRGWLPRHIMCFTALYKIVNIVRRGLMTTEVWARMNVLINTHATLWLELYGNEPSKMKFHNLFDLPDDLRRIGSCLGCFVTERENKDANAAAATTYRHLERTATCKCFEQHARSLALAG